ncbi:MAG TPA: hypothetical protein VKQ36_01280 [Ktedonobacterales bacterium]|nr:hypothetical protein [Ktedonobacterales bacterium]
MWDVIAPVIGYCRACGADLSIEVRLRATEEWADRYSYDERLRRKIDRAVVRIITERHMRSCPAGRRPARQPRTGVLA